MSLRTLLVPALGLTLLLSPAAFAAPRPQQSATPVAATPEGDAYAQITTEVFVSAPPAAVVDGQLALALVTVPAGAQIGSHSHPGSQFATIAGGELTYTVETGTVLMRRAGSAADAPWEEITPGETVVLGVGDTIREAPGDLHHAENAGSEPVLIWIASLFPDGSPRAVPAPTPQM